MGKTQMKIITRFTANSDLVHRFVEETGDPNPIHQDSDLAKEVFKRVYGEDCLNSNLRGNHQVIMPGALPIQYTESTISGPQGYPSGLTRISQDYRFLKLVLTGTNADVYMVTTEIIPEKTNGYYNIETLFSCNGIPVIKGRAKAIPDSITRQDIFTSPERLNTVHHQKTIRPNLRYLNLLRLGCNGRIPLEYWPIEVIKTVSDQLKSAEKITLFCKQSMRLDSFLEDGEKTLEIEELPPTEKKKPDGSLLGLEKTIKVRIAVKEDPFLSGTSSGLELQIQ